MIIGYTSHDINRNITTKLIQNLRGTVVAIEVRVVVQFTSGTSKKSQLYIHQLKISQL